MYSPAPPCLLRPAEYGTSPGGSGSSLPFGKPPVVGVGRSRLTWGVPTKISVLAAAGRAADARLAADVRDEIERAVSEGGETRRARIEESHADITFPGRYLAIQVTP
jgi:hypothetical protein